MGKKRRILTRNKFAALRKHRKFRGLVEANLTQEKPEEPEVVVEVPELKIEEPPTPKAPKVKKATPKASAKKASTPKKPAARRKTSKKATIKAPR
tara:strand:+ start:786 stop:1070 length:285 start_codon:yes stop_codon:yes gene_type:complete